MLLVLLRPVLARLRVPYPVTSSGFCATRNASHLPDGGWGLQVLQ
jgi:hypothetical protein